MAKICKIVKYQLEDAALALLAQGKTTAQIAEALTADLKRRGLDDTVSQPTVSRWIKPFRDEVREEAREIITGHIKAQLPSDLEALDEIEAFHLGIFRDKDRVDKDRSEYGMKALKVVETKLRFAIGGDPGSGTASDPRGYEDLAEELADLKAEAEAT